MNLPFFSIIVPTFNRPGKLESALKSFSKLDYPRERFEVIVVDDGSHAPLDAVIKLCRDKYALTLLKQNNMGPASARNLGAEKAKGDYLAFTDDDCELDHTWLKMIAERIKSAPGCIIGGKTISTIKNNPYPMASQLLIDYIYEYYNADAERARFIASNNMIVPSKIFTKIGGFDVTYSRSASEDRELCDHWLYNGRRMVYEPKALVYHSHDLNFPSFCRQHFNYGRGAFRFHRIRSRRGKREPIKIEPLSFYLNLMSYPFSYLNGLSAFTISALMIVTQSMGALGFYWEKLIRTLDKTT